MKEIHTTVHEAAEQFQDTLTKLGLDEAVVIYEHPQLLTTDHGKS